MGGGDTMSRSNYSRRASGAYALVGKCRTIALALGVCLTWSWPIRAAADCPGECQGGTNHGGPCLVPADCPGSGATCANPAQCVNIEFRPSTQSAPTNATFEVGLYAVNNSQPPTPIPALVNIQGIDLILSWSPSEIQLLGTSDPCHMCDGGSNADRYCINDAQCPGSSCVPPDSCGRGCVGGVNAGVFCDADSDCPGSVCGDFGSFCLANTYHWALSSFPDDCSLDGVNAPCPGGPENDGDAFYEAVSQFFCSGASAPPAMSTPEGLLVTSFRFKMLATSGDAHLHIVPALGDYTRTRVIGGDTPGENLTGLLGPDATITVGTACNPPTVTALGPRYLGVTPVAGDAPIALQVRGVSAAVNCVDLYVQANCQGGSNAGAICSVNADCPGGLCNNTGTLGSTAVYRTPADWGTVAVRSNVIGPLTTYDVRTDCGPTPGVVLSMPVSGTTWRHGNTDNNAVVNFADVSRCVAGFQGEFSPTLTIENVDLTGVACLPNRSVNFQDISAAISAFQSVPFAYCSPPCP